MKKTFICPTCGTRNRIDSVTGATHPVPCDKCGNLFRLPSAAKDDSNAKTNRGEFETQIVDMRSELKDVQALDTYVGSRESIVHPNLDNADARAALSRKKTMMLSDSSQEHETSPGTAVNLESDTQSQYVAQGARLGIWGVCAIAIILLTVSIWVGFVMPANNNARVADELFRSWAQHSAEERVRSLAQAVQVNMTNGRPDLAHQLVTQSSREEDGDSLIVLRTDGTVAFAERDWSTYRQVVERLCDEDFLNKVSDEDRPFAKQAQETLLKGGDTRLAMLGDNPCIAIQAPTTHRKAPSHSTLLPPNVWAQGVSGKTATSTSWVENTNADGHRALIAVHPIMGDDRCKVCHTRTSESPPRVYGLAINRLNLTPWDSAADKAEDDMVMSATGVALFGALLLLIIVVLFRRRQSS